MKKKGLKKLVFQKTFYMNGIGINNIAHKRINQQAGLKPFGDYDGDGVKNILDCWPKNPLLQGPEHGSAVSNIVGNNINATDASGNPVKVNARTMEDLLPSKNYNVEMPKGIEAEIVDENAKEDLVNSTEEVIEDVRDTKADQVELDLYRARELEKIKASGAGLTAFEKAMGKKEGSRVIDKTPRFVQDMKLLKESGKAFKSGLAMSPSIRKDAIGGFVGDKKAATRVSELYGGKSAIPLQSKVGLVRSRNVFSGDPSSKLNMLSTQQPRVTPTSKIAQFIGGKQGRRLEATQEHILEPAQEPTQNMEQVDYGYEQPQVQPQVQPVAQPQVQPVAQPGVVRSAESDLTRQIQDIKMMQAPQSFAQQSFAQSGPQVGPVSSENLQSGVAQATSPLPPQGDWVVTKEGKRIPRRNAEGKTWSNKSQRYVTYTREKYDKIPDYGY